MTADELLKVAEAAEAAERASTATANALVQAKEDYAKTSAKYHVGELIRDRRETVHRIDAVYVELNLEDADAPIDVRYSTVVQRKKGGDKHRAAFGHVREVSGWVREVNVIGWA